MCSLNARRVNKSAAMALWGTGSFRGPFGSTRLGSGADAGSRERQLFREVAKLWPLYCNTCHNARPGSEKAAYEWDQIIMYMRMLGNVPPNEM